MKTFVFSAVAMAVLASCTNSAIDDVVNNDEPVAIRLSAGVQANGVKDTRAPITGSATFQAIVLGWEGDTPNYTVAPKWNASTSNINATGSTGNITLTEPQYYLADGTKTYMKAFYAEGATVNETNKYIYDFDNTDGQKDILMASAVEGSKITATPVNFAFKHPLMQLKFKLVAGKGFPSGVTVTSITVKNAKRPIGVDLSKDEVKYTDVDDITVPNASSGEIKGEVVGNPLMVEPFAGKTFNVDIKASGDRTYSNILVTLESVEGNDTGAGIAYEVTLTFQEKMTASASVTDWSTGTGSGTVE